MFWKGLILCLRCFPSTAGLPGCSLHVLQWYCSRRRHPFCLEPQGQLPQTGMMLSQGLHREPVPLWVLPGAHCCCFHLHLGCGCHQDCCAELSGCKALLLSAPMRPESSCILTFKLHPPPPWFPLTPVAAQIFSTAVLCLSGSVPR